jgi:hypothetical protein
MWVGGSTKKFRLELYNFKQVWDVRIDPTGTAGFRNQEGKNHGPGRIITLPETTIKTFLRRFAKLLRK